MTDNLAVSRFLRSACCSAPVAQTVESEPWLYPVHCTRCGVELGAPGAEDVRPLPAIVSTTTDGNVELTLTVDASRLFDAFDRLREGLHR